MASGLTKKGAAKGKAASLPLVTESVPIDSDCVGSRWVAHDEQQLARLIAIIAMGQAMQAVHILRELIPATPAFTELELVREAKIKLTVQEKKATPRTGYPQWQRDGFMFEAISWIASQQISGSRALIKGPHISSTSQGLDGLMIELTDDKSAITRTTVFEDKCTDDPRGTFTGKVMPAFLSRHANKRSAELVDAASVLLRTAGIDEAAAAQLSAAVTERKKRCYRAAFALTEADDGDEQRKELFEGFNALTDITAEQRVGAGLIVSGNMRAWFDQLASQAIDYLDELAKAKA